MNKKTPWLLAFLGLTLLVAVAYHHHHRVPFAGGEAPSYTGAGLEDRANTPPGMGSAIDGSGRSGGVE